MIPINPETKRPIIKWKDYQTRHPTEDELEVWWSDWPDAQIAVVTGEISGIVVVDCDTEEARLAAFDAGMRSPIRVATKRGEHRYFKHPLDGIRRGPRAGGNSRGADWPKIPGLDFRGDGSYALLPPSNGYSWSIPPHVDMDDDTPVWQDWRPDPVVVPAPGEFSFANLDLSGVAEPSEEDFMSEWERTARFVELTFPTTRLIPTGQSNGRNERVMRHVSDCVLEGVFGDELMARAYAFMREFFMEPLPDAEVQATVRSIEEAERRNHPERFDEEGKYIATREPGPITALGDPDELPKVETKPAKRLIQMKDAEELLAEAGGQTYLIEPWLAPTGIVQVYGYSGHGKSMFLQHMLAALASGRKYAGPFEVNGPARILYLDYEMGMATVARRLLELRSAHGHTHDHLNIWAPFINGRDMNLRTNEGLLELTQWIEFSKPDVVVIDTVRSAFVGMEENSSKDWGQVNSLATKIRNAGMAVIVVHHSNKPQGDAATAGREAGSTNQLTVLDGQIRVTQVFEDEAIATQKAGIWDESYATPVWPQLRRKLPESWRLYMVVEVSMGKVREWTEMHDQVQWIGYASNDKTDERMLVSSLSTKQKAKNMALDGHMPEDIATALSKPVRVIEDWLGMK